MIKNTILYFHRRNDTNEVFYVGIGTKYRPKSIKNRNEYWHNIVNKVGYTIDIICVDLSWEEACVLEKQYIKKFGRKDLGLGNLVNMTDGGDGTKGHKVAEKVKKERSERMFGKKQDTQTNIKKSQSLKEFWADENNKKMMSFSIKEAHNNNPSIAIKISERLTNRIITNNTKEKMSVSAKKRPPISKATRQKIKNNSTGEKNGNSKLNEKLVLEIRKKYSTGNFSYTSLGFEYNVSKVLIRKVVIKELWKHI
jgi:hypothetical protein